VIAVVDDSKEVETAAGDGAEERSQTDKLVDGMDFGELCNDFECISSPYVEATARQLARDILDLRDDNRAFTCYAVSVKYKVCASPLYHQLPLYCYSVLCVISNSDINLVPISHQCFASPFKLI
jgi:hypothetical protein